MNNLWQQISDYYSKFAVSTQFSNLTLGSFCNPAKPAADYPRLKGRGAEVKHLAKPLLAIWEKIRRPGNIEDGRIFLALRSLCQIHDVIDEYSKELFLP